MGRNNEAISLRDAAESSGVVKRSLFIRHPPHLPLAVSLLAPFSLGLSFQRREAPAPTLPPLPSGSSNDLSARLRDIVSRHCATSPEPPDRSFGRPQSSGAVHCSLWKSSGTDIGEPSAFNFNSELEFEIQCRNSYLHFLTAGFFICYCLMLLFQQTATDHLFIKAPGMLFM